MLTRVTAGDVLERVVQALAEMRSTERLLAVILTETLRMLDAQGAYVLWRVGDRLVLRASVGLVPPGRDAGLPLGAGIEGWVAQHGEAAALTSPARAAGLGVGDLGLVGSLLAVPMRLRGSVVGVLAATRATPGRFAESDRWWLSIFAELAAVALENARLLERERRRAREAEVLAELAAVPTDPLNEFARRVAEGVNRLLGAERTEMLLAAADGTLQPLQSPTSARPAVGAAPPRAAGGKGLGGVAPGRTAAARAWRPATERRRPEPAPGGVGPLVQVYQAGEPLLCNDLTEAPALAAEIDTPDIRSVLAVPLWVGETRRGVLWTGARRANAFGPEDQTFLTLVAARVGLRLGADELARRRAEIERAEVEQQAKRDFLSVISHELKTPVAVIKAYTEVLEQRAERTGASPADREVLARIGEQANRMLGLVDQFLDLQRIETGLMPLELSRFDLAEVARRLAQALQVTTTAHRIRVEAPKPVWVRADRRRIEQVLQNLLDNAIKYSPAGGPIVVRVTTEPVSPAPPAATGTAGEPHGDGAAPAPPTPGAPLDASRALPAVGTREPGVAVVSVQDWGVGISAEAAKHIFERFYQADNVPVRGHVGLGLGLYISREIITRHGGDIWVESEPGKGSTFWFTLPLARRGPSEG